MRMGSPKARRTVGFKRILAHRRHRDIEMGHFKELVSIGTLNSIPDLKI